MKTDEDHSESVHLISKKNANLTIHYKETRFGPKDA